MREPSSDFPQADFGREKFDNKTAQEIQYRDWLFDDLLHQRTFFRSGPYEAHVQFSNFCNMSCIMCWDGRNPPTEKTSPEMLEKIGQQVAPHLSVITPYSGSEPLVLSWDETRDMAKQHSILLCITTNCQYLDEARFHELKDITETLLLSIDSHIPEVFEIIRPGGNVEKVFANLKTTAKLAREHRIECIVNIVLMTHNAPHLAETIEYLGKLGIETVNVIQMLDVNSRSQYYDPLLHFSEQYIAWVKERCLKAVQQQQMRLIWSVAGCTKYDFRPADHVQPLDRKSWSDYYDYRMKRIFPGFCRNVFNRLRVDSAGDVAPCCYAVQGELSLGNLNESSFEEIWNGASAQDLRRGMFCGDVPSLCSSCRYIDPIAPQNNMEFLALIDDQLQTKYHRTKTAVEKSIELIAPHHGQRLEQNPELAISHVANTLPTHQQDATYHAVLSLGGEPNELHQAILEPVLKDDVVQLQLPPEIWQNLRTNVGYWWNVWVIPTDRKLPIRRAEFSMVLMAHQLLPRLPDSKLSYKDKGALPIVDLGVAKQQGWTNPAITPGRPTVDPTQFGQQNDDEARNVPAPKQTQATEPTTAKSSSSGASIWKRLLQSLGESGDSARENTNQLVLDGHFDRILLTDDHLFLVGWILLTRGPADSVEFHSPTGKTVKAKRISRPDLVSNFSQVEASDGAGFEAKLKATHFQTDSGYEFVLVTYLNDEIASRLHVKIETTKESALPNKAYWFGNLKQLVIK